MGNESKEDLSLNSKENPLDQGDKSLESDLLRPDKQSINKSNLYLHYLKKTVYNLLIIFSLATILSHYFFPLVYTYGEDMSPKVEKNSLLIGNKLGKIKQDDILAYYYGNETIVSRALALPGQLVERDLEGNIRVDGKIVGKDSNLDAKNKNKAKPFSIRVPEESIFVLKDKSKILINDENKDLFIIKNKQVISKMFMILWPTNNIKIL